MSLAAVAFLVLGLMPASSFAATLTSTDTLVVEFRILPQFGCAQGGCNADSIRLALGPVNVRDAYTEWGSALYDGKTMLGSYSYNGYGQHEGHLPGLSPARFHDQEVAFNKSTGVDFRTFDDGSIQGRIELGIFSGAVDLELANLQLRLRDDGGVDHSGDVAMVSADIVRGGSRALPEPSAAVLFVAGFAVVAAARRRRV